MAGIFFSVQEFVDVLIMTAFIGFIFKDFFVRRPRKNYDPLLSIKRGFDWDNFWFACAIVAPAIFLHELAHKFVGLSFGLSSTFHAAYMWLLIGLVLKLMSFSFIFFVPAYVSTVGTGTHLEFAAIAIAGPLMNCFLWLGATLLLKFGKLKQKYVPFVLFTQKINMFLFFFNLIPIPPFDGGNFFFNLWQAFF